DVLRYQIEPLVITARSESLARDPARAKHFLEAQLAYDQRLVDSAHLQQEAIKAALAAYESDRNATNFSAAKRPSANQSVDRQSTPSTEAVMPQLSDTFLDRLVDLTSRASDSLYRQHMIDDLREASVNAIPRETAVAYDQTLLSA